MLRASRRGASAPASASCPSVWLNAGTGTHHTSAPRKTADFSRAGSSIQNRSIKFSRCVSVAHVTASDERCCEECGPEYPPELTITSPKRSNIGRTEAGVSDPLENSAFRNSKMIFSESRSKYGCGRSPSRGAYCETELSIMQTLSRLASSIAP